MMQIHALGIDNALIEKVIPSTGQFLNRQFAQLARA